MNVQGPIELVDAFVTYAELVKLTAIEFVQVKRLFSASGERPSQFAYFALK